MKPRVAYYEVLNFFPENQQILETNFDLVRLESPDQDTPQLLSTLDGIIAPLKYTWDRQKIDACRQLKVIASQTGGVPHIDEAYATSKGIRVLHLQGQFESMRITSAPEMAWGLMINLIRHIPWAHKAVLDGEWERMKWRGEKMLSNMDLGIVGLGRIGRYVAGYGLAFGMTVRYYDPYVEKSPVEGVARSGTLEELVGRSDVVCLHVMLSDENERLIDRAILRRFRPGSVLINNARGPLVDSVALVEALEAGQLAGAAVDVIPEEFDHDFNGDVSNHPLVKYARKHNNLLITPHISGSTLDSWGTCQHRIIEMLIDALQDAMGERDA